MLDSISSAGAVRPIDVTLTARDDPCQMRVMHRALTYIATAATVVCVSTSASAQDARPDGGFRLHATLGYPAAMALGIGYKLPTHTEFMLQGGGAALGFVLFGTAEFSVSQDVLRGQHGLMHVGLAGSFARMHAFTVDCYGDESCEDVIREYFYASPRLGLRLHLDRRSKRRSGWYLEGNAGPQLVRCEACPHQTFVNAAANVRVIWDVSGR